MDGGPTGPAGGPVSYWELAIDCDERLFAAAVLRLKQRGLTSCVVDRRAGERIGFRVFLPEDTERAALFGLTRNLSADAERLHGRPPAVRYRKTDTCEAPSAWEPTDVGPRLRVQPASAPLPTDGRLAVRLLPRAAFGSTHPSTRLCLEALQARELAGLRLADVGCGSGVLGIAAARLGAAHIAAVDVDPVAVTATRDNAALNDVALEAHAGSLERLRGEAFDAVICNALPDVLEQVVPRLAQLGSDWALISGFRESQRQRVEALCRDHGWTIARRRAIDGWVLAELERTEA
jgi:ribosomal protein L11 methyltransferase